MTTDLGWILCSRYKGERRKEARMSTPAKCHRVGQTSIYTMYDVRVPDRKKKKEGGGEGLYEYSSQVPISAPIDPPLTSNDANMRKLVSTPYCFFPTHIFLKFHVSMLKVCF